MSGDLPISSPYRSTPEAPVDDTERERLNGRLNTAFASGALDEEQYRARLDALYAARRLGDLVPVVQGLPPAPTYASPAIVASSGGRPGELAEPRPAGAVTALVVGGVVVLIVILAVLLVVLL